MMLSFSAPISDIPGPLLPPTKKPRAPFKPSCCTNSKISNQHSNGEIESTSHQTQTGHSSSGLCKCGRRHWLGTMATNLFSTSLPALAFENGSHHSSYSEEMLKKVHPPRADWYEEFYASVMNNSMQAYEAEVASYKSQLFNKLRGQAKEIAEIGIGTGPNLKYYVTDASMRVFGIDPNRKMEKYARAAAEAAGLSLNNFEFVQAVGEGLPLDDASVDAVIGTLVLCSVKDVERTLKEVKRVLRPGGLYLFIEHVGAKKGTPLRFVQTVLDPLQQLLADGCHLTRETQNYIAEAGFSGVDTTLTRVSNASFINPHIYGTARK